MRQPRSDGACHAFDHYPLVVAAYRLPPLGDRRHPDLGSISPTVWLPLQVLGQPPREAAVNAIGTPVVARPERILGQLAHAGGTSRRVCVYTEQPEFVFGGRHSGERLPKGGGSGARSQ